MEMGGQRQAPAALPPGKTRYPFYRRLGGSQSWSGRVPKPRPPPGFDHWTVQPVASRYTDCAIPAHTHKQQTVQQMCLFIVHPHYKLHMSKSNNTLQSPLHRKLKGNNRTATLLFSHIQQSSIFQKSQFLPKIYYHTSLEGPILCTVHTSPPYSHY